jgi:hypothetical protein
LEEAVGGISFFHHLAMAATCGGKAGDWMDANAVVILVIGVVTVTVAFVGLMIKLIELGRK